jgi:hypothetical protein
MLDQYLAGGRCRRLSGAWLASSAQSLPHAGKRVQEAPGHGLRPSRCFFFHGLASITARIASRWLCKTSRKASTVGDDGAARRQLIRNSTGVDKLLMKFFAPLGGQRPAKTDVEPPFVKRPELLSGRQFEQS